MKREAYNAGYKAGKEMVSTYREIVMRQGNKYGQEFRFPVISLLDNLRQAYSYYKFVSDFGLHKKGRKNDSKAVVDMLDSFLAGVNTAMFESIY